jgi:hypothetical protein
MESINGSAIPGNVPHSNANRNDVGRTTITAPRITRLRTEIEGSDPESLEGSQR